MAGYEGLLLHQPFLSAGGLCGVHKCHHAQVCCTSRERGGRGGRMVRVDRESGRMVVGYIGAGMGGRRGVGYGGRMRGGGWREV